MQLTIKIDWGEGPHEVTTKPSAIITWERKFKTKIGKIESTGLGIEDLAFMAHVALRQEGTTVPDFEKFIENLTEIEVLSETEASPFPKEASDE
jgi:hypothetical protein